MATLNATTVVTKPGSLEPTVLYAGEDVPDWAEPLIGDHLVGGPSESPRAVGEVKSDAPDGSWTVAELKDYARANDVDLHGATSKSDILAAIQG